MKAYLSLGSNLDPDSRLREALDRIESLGRIEARSARYRSPPQDGYTGPDYCNVAVRLDTDLSVAELKSQLRAIEESMGRVRPSDRPAIDIDIIFADGAPAHPDSLRYAHVAVPMAEIAPRMRHPSAGDSLQAIAARFA